MALKLGGAGIDILVGLNESDLIIGYEGDDILKGFGGDDILLGGSGADSMSGGEGRDTYYVDDAGDAVLESESAGTDTVYASVDYELPDHVEDLYLLNGANDGIGNALANDIEGNDAANVLEGLDGDDDLAGKGGDDVLYGGDGEDVLVGGAGADTLYGGDHSDDVFGGAGADTLYGGAGNDNFDVMDAGDVVHGGSGYDTVFSDIAEYTLPNDVEELYLLASTAFNGTGNGSANQIFGNGNGNVLSGAGGNDVLHAGHGEDTLDGGANNDTLKGGLDRDVLTGGSGADFFVWRQATETGLEQGSADVVTDFSFVAGDRIDLADVDADVYAAADQAFTFIGQAAFSGTPGEINYYHAGGNTYIQLQTGTSGDVEGVIRLDGIHDPEAGWFIL